MFQKDGSSSTIVSDGIRGADSSSVCFDSMSSFNVTVSRKQKSVPRQASTSTEQSPGSAAIGSPLLDSSSTFSGAFQPPSMVESIGNFDADKIEAEARTALTGSGLLSGDMSATFPESVERAAEVLQHTREVLAHADTKSGASTGSGDDDDQGRDGKITTEDLEGLSRALKRALFVCPNHKELHAMRGEVHRRLQDFRTAVGCLRLAVRMDNSSLSVRQRLAEVLLSQGMVWLDGGDHAAALECFNEACTVDGANASVHFCKTVALVKLTRFGDALRAMEAVLGRRKGTADDYVLRAKILWAMGMVAPGNNDMEAARKLRSDHPEVVMYGRRCLGDAATLYVKASTLADAGDDAGAVKILNKVAELTPDDVKVLIVRAACKGRLKDFVGALRDYDEASFRHFEGVHVGRRALDRAACLLRDSRGEGRGWEDAVGSITTPAPQPPQPPWGRTPSGAAAANGGVFAGEQPQERVVATTVGNSKAIAGGGIVGGYAMTPAEGRDVGRETGAMGEGTGGGDEGVLGGSNLESVLSAPQRDVNLGILSGGERLRRPRRAGTGTQALDSGEIEQAVEAQAENERLAEEELRRRFRLAIPHAGPDPDYALQPSPSFFFAQQQQQEQEQQQRQQQQRQQQRGRQDEPASSRSLSLLSSISSSSSPSFSPLRHVLGMARAEGGLLRAAGREGLEEPSGDEGQSSQRQLEGEGERYTEPPYITRQRCLVLNDWALSLFEIGQYVKAVLALNLAIEGDQAFARATKGPMESKLFLNRGDCYRGGGAVELAACDYKRALEVDPRNWMVKTRLSLAHYLKGNSLFNNGDFAEAKIELDTAIAYNWKLPTFVQNNGSGLEKVSTYYLLRGQAQYFSGEVSGAHADYLKALQLDPGNAVSQRLCRQFDAKGKLISASKGASPGETEKKVLPAVPSRPGMERRTSALTPPALSSPSSSPVASFLTPSSRPPNRAPVSSSVTKPPPPSLNSSTYRCHYCGSATGSGCCKSSEPRASGLPVTQPRRPVNGGTLRAQRGCSVNRQSKRRGRRRYRRERGGGELSLPTVDTRPPRRPEWEQNAISWVKTGNENVRRVFQERFQGVPSRDDTLWRMLKSSPPKSWASARGSAAAAAGEGLTGGIAGGASASATAMSTIGGRQNLSEPNRIARSQATAMSWEDGQDECSPVCLHGTPCLRREQFFFRN